MRVSLTEKQSLSVLYESEYSVAVQRRKQDQNHLQKAVGLSYSVFG